MRLTLEIPNSGLLGVDGVEAAFVMAVLEVGVLEGVTTGMLEGGVTPDAGGGVMLEVGAVTALALTTPMVVLVGVTGAERVVLEIGVDALETRGVTTLAVT